MGGFRGQQQVKQDGNVRAAEVVPGGEGGPPPEDQGARKGVSVLPPGQPTGGQKGRARHPEA